MIEEQATVVKIEGHDIWVEGTQSNACGSCQQKASCSTQALSQLSKKKVTRVNSTLDLHIGDPVIIAIDEGLLLRASALLYFLPLIGLFIGAFLANFFLASSDYKDIGMAVSAVTGFLICLLLIHQYQKSLAPCHLTEPTVVRKL